MELARQSMALCHGIGFSPTERSPFLRLRHGGQWINEPLDEGRTFSLQIGETKWCLGYVRMSDDGRRSHHICPRTKALNSGTQCAACRRLDQTKFMHHFHKTGEAPEGLRRYLEQPHFLYVASFANGTTKVGTTSTQSKWTRLVTQGAVSARYIARAADGAAIRILEDLVTEHCGLRQQVRQKAKIQGLCSWEHNLDSLESLNTGQAERARAFLAAQRGLEGYGITLLDEPWQQPEYGRSVVRAWDDRSLQAWPGGLPGRKISLQLRGVLGQSLMVDTGPETNLVVLDAAELKTRSLRVGPAHFGEQGGQSSLF
ncbi:DUF2797 domain-containing protein [Glutamicibacter sp. MNS18]|uniref:DUF2797 domain-containing protein n=1 Tax=Glutamicibacter sp. MNS18 TaxID=2989817 RepID=UPI002236875D|nr:DUF2797 domain-containing protein [Glutamicibacter sp. MNS18]MCW4464113.1 DUF2797 domain-containing protein [Glutamicibacter sp. MNS18]